MWEKEFFDGVKSTSELAWETCWNLILIKYMISNLYTRFGWMCDGVEFWKSANFIFLSCNWCEKILINIRNIQSPNHSHYLPTVTSSTILFLPNNKIRTHHVHIENHHHLPKLTWTTPSLWWGESIFSIELRRSPWWTRQITSSGKAIIHQIWLPA